MKVAEIMSRNLVTVGPDDELYWARDAMRYAEIRHLPVVKQGKLVGLLTEKDILRASTTALAQLSDADREKELLSVYVAEIMQRRVLTVGPEDDVRLAIELLQEKKYGCLPVVEGMTLKGIVTESDFLRVARSILTVSDRPCLLMTTELMTVDENTDLCWIDDMMDILNIRHMPVVAEHDRLIGLVTQRDLLRASVSAIAQLNAEEHAEFLEHVVAKQVMATRLITVTPDDDLCDAIDLMLQSKCGCLPVVHDQRLVGLITEADFLDFVSTHLARASSGALHRADVSRVGPALESHDRE